MYMKTSDAVSYFGSKSKLAKAFSPPLSKGSITHWTNDGRVPRGRAFELQMITKGALKVDLSLYENDQPKSAA